MGLPLPVDQPHLKLPVGPDTLDVLQTFPVRSKCHRTGRKLAGSPPGIIIDIPLLRVTLEEHPTATADALSRTLTVEAHRRQGVILRLMVIRTETSDSRRLGFG